MQMNLPEGEFERFTKIYIYLVLFGMGLKFFSCRGEAIFQKEMALEIGISVENLAAWCLFGICV